jgi:hypothetical protein
MMNSSYFLSTLPLRGSTLCRPLSDGGGVLSAALPVVRGGMRWHTYRHYAEQGKTDRDEGALPGSDGGSASKEKTPSIPLQGEER